MQKCNCVGYGWSSLRVWMICGRTVCAFISLGLTVYKPCSVNCSLKVKLMHYLSWLNECWPQCVVQHVMSLSDKYQWSEITSPFTSVQRHPAVMIDQSVFCNNSFPCSYKHSNATILCWCFLRSCSMWQVKSTSHYCHQQKDQHIITN